MSSPEPPVAQADHRPAPGRPPRRPILLVALVALAFAGGVAVGAATPARPPSSPGAMAGTSARLAGGPPVGPPAAPPGARRASPGPEGDPGPSLPPAFRIVEQARDIIDENYVDPAAADDRTLAQGAVRGMVEALGDTGHTVYLSPEEVRLESESMDGRITGIGVVVDDRSGVPEIISVIDGSPADGAGLRAGDLIVAVDGERVERIGPEEIVSRVRGPAGTEVRLTIEREGESAPLEVSIERASIEIPSTSWAMVPGTDVADIRLVQFSRGAARDVRGAVTEALAAGARGFVLDLRGNPGGLVDEATSVAGAFLEDGVAFRQQDREGRTSDIHVTGQAVAPDVPLVVLVDYGSASSSEIVAAALRDGGRARVIGERTFGTGTVLNTYGLSDGSAIQLGILRWLTPKGDLIFREGVAPDEEVALAPGAALLAPADLEGLPPGGLEVSGDRQLARAVELLRSQVAGPSVSPPG